MVMYSPEQMLQDYAERTLKNLNYLEMCVTSYGRQVYEVTQVINSLLGVVVFPHEMASASIPALALETLPPAQWPEPVRDMNQYFVTLPEFLRCWRHAIAHGHIHFLPNADNDIESVMFEATCDHNRQNVDWKISLSVDEMFVLVRTLCAMWTDNQTIIAFPAPPQANRNRGQGRQR